MDIPPDTTISAPTTTTVSGDVRLENQKLNHSLDMMRVMRVMIRPPQKNKKKNPKKPKKYTKKNYLLFPTVSQISMYYDATFAFHISYYRTRFPQLVTLLRLKIHI